MSDLGPVRDWDVPSSSGVSHLLAPESLQGRGVINRAGEFGLLWAVFSDGVRTYCEEILGGKTGSFTYREVHRWIFREGSDEVTSFSSLCELFGIDPRSMRRVLIRFREQPNVEILDVFTTKVA